MPLCDASVCPELNRFHDLSTITREKNARTVCRSVARRETRVGLCNRAGHRTHFGTLKARDENLYMKTIGLSIPVILFHKNRLEDGAAITILDIAYNSSTRIMDQVDGPLTCWYLQYMPQNNLLDYTKDHLGTLHLISFGPIPYESNNWPLHTPVSPSVVFSFE